MNNIRESNATDDRGVPPPVHHIVGHLHEEDKKRNTVSRSEEQLEYSVALQKAIEHHCRGVGVPAEIAAKCPHHALMLNERLAKVIGWPDTLQIEAMRELSQDTARRMIEAVETIQAIRAENQGQRWSHTLEMRMLAVFDSVTHAQLVVPNAKNQGAGEPTPLNQKPA